jgi:anti-anti-sigma factor
LHKGSLTFNPSLHPTDTFSMVTSQGEGFAVQVARHGTGALVTVAGDIDISTADALQAALDRVADCPLIELDLAEVVFVDSTGIGVVAQALARARVTHRMLTLREASSAVRRAFELSGIGDALGALADDDATTTSTTLEVVNRFNAATARHDVDEMVALVTPDVLFETTAPPDGAVVIGRGAVRAVWEDLFRNAPNAHLEAEEVIAVGQHCTVCWRYVFDRTEPASGHIRGVDVIRVSNGLIAEKRSYVKG